MELRTKRLRLREVDDRYISHFMRHLNYPEIAYFQCHEYPFTKNSTEEMFSKFRELKKLNPRRGYYFAIDFGKTFAGYIDIEGINKNDGLGFLSYWLSGFFQKEGVMSEAFDEILKFSFNYLDLKNLTACVAKNNRNSINLLKAKGFQIIEGEGGLFQSPVDNKIYESVIFSLSRHEHFRRLHEKD